MTDREPLVPDDRTIEQRLTALEQASDERRAELRAQLDALPAAVSRRSVLAGAVVDIRHAPDKAQIVGRGMRKIARAPFSLVRRVIRRNGRR